MLSVVLLSAGFGKRLHPYTENWPKCLMPVNGIPLLQYWIDTAQQIRADRVLVNLHYLPGIVEEFLNLQSQRHNITAVYESILEGTAGTLRSNFALLKHSRVLLAHADNFCRCNFQDFLEFHNFFKPKYCPITMMTFESDSPNSCGIVELDGHGVVVAFHEKVANPPGTLANGAVYLLESEVLEWIFRRKEVTDFSTQVLPSFLGRIATWKNSSTHIDIGSINALRQAQKRPDLDLASRVKEKEPWLRTYGSVQPEYRKVLSSVS